MRLKAKVAVVALVTAAALVSTAGSGLTAPPGNGPSVQDTTGDHPLTTSFTLTGRTGVTVSALRYNNRTNPGGRFTVSGVPAGSTIVKALLYLTDWQTGATASGIFAGVPFGPAPPLTTDTGAGLILGAYRFDVTSQVTGNGPYVYTSSGIRQTYGSALVVVYRNDLLRPNKIWVNDGAELMAETTSETGYIGGPRRPKTGRLIVFTQGDNTGQTGEVISLNGTAVGGPIDANLGCCASLFDLTAPGIVATNKVAINTPADLFGWHLAILARKKQ